MNDPRFRRLFLPAALMALALVFAFASGYLVRLWVELDAQDYPILREARDLLAKEGLKPLPPDPALEYGAVNGLVQAYGDPYTLFVEPAQAELQSNDLQGKFGGIGARLEKDAEGTVRLYPYPDSPALEAGIQEGDRLIQVEDHQIPPEEDLSTVDAAIRGPVGQAVHLVIGHAPDFAPEDVQVQRKEIAIPSLTWNLAAEDPRVGVIHVHIIAATTPAEIQKAVQDLTDRGASAFILDLRDNGGGLLDAGIDTARLFLRDGVVISQQYRDKNVETYKVTKPGALSDLPLVILVNHNTASAAEILAGALQVQGRAKLVGVPTYGKDTIQLVYDLKDGSSLHVTAARWWLPGREAGIAGQGLQPDVPVSGDAAADVDYMQLAIQTLGLK